MIRIIRFAALLMVAALPVRAEMLWLAVGASNPSPGRIAGAGLPFHDLFPRGFVAKTSDCGDSPNLFVWVAAAGSKRVANEALSRLSAITADAYVRRCNVQARSLLETRVSAVDDSLSRLVQPTLNWPNQRLVASAHALDDGSVIVVQPYFIDDEYSELYGWHERVIADDPIFPLEVDCPDSGGFAQRHGWLAYHCGQEWVAEQLLHAVIVHDEYGRQLHYIEHCRDPVWSGDQTIACNAERVTFEGEIALEEKRVSLPQEVVPQGSPERLWLVVGASDLTPGGIARQSKTLSERFPRGFVVQSSDCGEAKNIFAWVAEAATSPEVADAALQHLRAVVKDAYVKRCDARPGTLLALRINAVDKSVAGMQEWGFDDWSGVSSAHPLSDGRIVMVPRVYEEATSEYPVMSEPVIVREVTGDQRALSFEHCAYPGHFITQGDLLAFDCAPEVFADMFVYSVYVFDRTGRQLAKIKRCRYPIWSGDHVIACRKLVWALGPEEHTLIRTVIRE